MPLTVIPAQAGIHRAGLAGHDIPVIADLTRNPDVRGRAYNKPNQPTESPSPLMGEELKVRVKQDSPTIPSFPRRRESTGLQGQGRHTGFKAVFTGWGTSGHDFMSLRTKSAIQIVRGRADSKTNQPTESPLP